MLLRQEGALALVESWYGKNAESKRLVIWHVDDTAVYTVIMERLPIIIKTPGNFASNWHKPSNFHRVALHI